MKPDNTKVPVYAIDGKRFGTVAGLTSYLIRKHSATSVSGVSSDRLIKVYGHDRDTVVAQYRVGTPKLGADMELSLLAADDEDLGMAVEPRTVHCECGEWTGMRCDWIGSLDDTVLVEIMPEHLRATHEAAGNVGRYPYNGAIRVRCERSCAESIVKDDADWAWIVGGDA